MKIRVFDLETGPDPDELSNGVIEIGWCDVVAMNRDLLGSPIDWIVELGSRAMINPINPIPYEASSIHHIVDSDVRGMPKWDFVMKTIFTEDMTEGIIGYAAHSIETEQKFITQEFTGDKPWVCTFRCGLHLYPEATSHSNQSLRYMLRPEGLKRDLAQPVHRALPDSYVTAHTLCHMLNEGNSFESLVDLTKRPALLHWCKHRRWRDENGKPVTWDVVDDGYMRWMLGPDKDFSEDEKYTVRYHLEQREIDQRIERERRELERQFAANAVTVGVDLSSKPDQTAHYAVKETPSDREFAPIESYNDGRPF